jgi:hypothetical protein
LPSTSHHCITSSFVKLAKGKKLVHNRQDLFLVFPVFFCLFVCFNFYLMFPNVKKKKKKSRFLHQLGDHLKWDMQSSSVCTFLSFTFVALYNGVMDRKLDDMRLVGKCHLKNKNLQGSFYFATNLQSLLVFCFLLRRHMELKSFSCPILFNYLTNKHKL